MLFLLLKTTALQCTENQLFLYTIIMCRYLQCANETIRESEWIGASECALMLTEQFFSFIIVRTRYIRWDNDGPLRCNVQKISCFCIPLLCELPGLEPDFFWLKFPNESCSNDPYLEHILSFFNLLLQIRRMWLFLHRAVHGHGHFIFSLVPEPRSRYLQCANETIRESEWIGASECALMLTEQFYHQLIIWYGSTISRCLPTDCCFSELACWSSTKSSSLSHRMYLVLT
jgi:hypothetical protein